LTASPDPQRIPVTTDPENSEFPFAELDSWITPLEGFYVRNHFPVPEIDPRPWRLRVGNGSGGLGLTLAELEDLPVRSVVSVMECAGNGRRYNDPPVKGVQWGQGAVSNGEWSGPSLADVLAVAGAPEADHYAFTGADRGSVAGVPGEIPFRRSVPRAKALDPDTLIALRLNGEPLNAAHGAPARLHVPGWYGMASIKWLVAIEPVDRPVGDHFMAADYTRRAPDGGWEALEWVFPKAEIARPEEDAEPSAGPVEVAGAAWAGHSPLARVEVSVDGGATWDRAELGGPETRWGWRLWRWSWEAAPGEHRLVARATDLDDRTQPDEPDPDAPGYLNHWVRPRIIRVR
jgi:DMSO/TMAO reductase YedYZ molybdopterin-dependent catalytic subunit